MLNRVTDAVALLFEIEEVEKLVFPNGSAEAAAELFEFDRHFWRARRLEEVPRIPGAVASVCVCCAMHGVRA